MIARLAVDGASARYRRDHEADTMSSKPAVAARQTIKVVKAISTACGAPAVPPVRRNRIRSKPIVAESDEIPTMTRTVVLTHA